MNKIQSPNKDSFRYTKKTTKAILGYCQAGCGRPIYKADKHGVPFSYCFKCQFGGVNG